MVDNTNMNLPNSLLLCIFLTLVFVSSSEAISTYLQFSNQTENYKLQHATNIATLISGDLVDLPSNRFTICGSMYIGYFRGTKSFYTVRRNNENKLWFTLVINNQDTKESSYTTSLDFFSATVFSNTGAKLGLRPHSWSHACTTVNVDTGHVLVVINGILTHNITIDGKDFVGNVPTVFQNNLILGVRYLLGTPNITYQSEASISSVNIFSIPMKTSRMVEVTSRGQFQNGDVVAWSEAKWKFLGGVEEIEDIDGIDGPKTPHLIKMAEGFDICDDCLNLCPRVQAGGRVPFTRNTTDAENLARQFSEGWIWAPYRYETEGNFTDYYTGTPLTSDLWLVGQPNGGLKQQCTFWFGSNNDGKLGDMPCEVSYPGECLCQFVETPILRMRGLCKGSKIDTHFTVKNFDSSVVFMGIKGTEMKFAPTVSKWTMNVIREDTTGWTSAEETSFILGRHNWTIEGDSLKCNMGEPYSRQLKMSGCKTNGEFTCDDGQCVTMKQRCDQAPDCKDKSDERNCKMMVREEGYNKGVPPFTVDGSIVPVQLNISIDLLKIVDMEETDHKIDFQFEITLKWKENNRVVYHNLKRDNNLNVLSTEDISNMWLPQVIYDNTDQKEVTRLGAMWEWSTPISVIREGSFIRSGLDVVDETEIFKGGENTLSMQQVYTWQFQCTYNLKDYPFDTQVTQVLQHISIF